MVLMAFALRATFAETKVTLGKVWPKEQRVSFDKVNHETWNRLVKQYVDSKGSVDYGKWSGTEVDVQALDEYLQSLSRAEPELPAEHSSRLAFWINAYNAVVVRALIQQPASDNQQRVLPKEVWADWRLQVGEKAYSLDQIEDDQLRKLQEPRIHFAIVCGAKGCPRLRDEAYTADRLESQLTNNSRDFFSDPSKFKFEPATNQLRLSPILQWYADDFGSDAAERLKKIAPYLPDAVRVNLGSKTQTTIEYLEYDSRTNGKAPADAPRAPK